MQRARRRSTGETLLAFKLTGDEWEALRAHRADIELADGCACGSLRRLHTGYKTFVHERDSGCSWTDREDHESESPEHETGKVVIERACGRAGWMAEVESPGPPIEPGSRTRKWWADVLASKGRVRIAFEVQWSTQTLARTWERQERYRGDGVRGCWFFRNPPPGSEVPDETCPMFPLELINVDNEEYAVMIGDRRVSLGQGVEDLLAGKVRLCQEVTTLWWEDARLTFAPARCPRCAEESYVHAATVTWHRPHYSPCGRLVYPSPGPESRTATGIEAIERADLAALVEQFFADKGAGLRASPYKQWEVRSDLEPAASSPLQMAPVEPAEPMAQPEPEAGTGTGVEAQGMGFLGRARRRLARLFGREPSPPVASSSPSDVIPMPPASPPLSSPPAPSPPAPTFVIGFGCPACETPFDAGAVADALAAAARTGTAIIIEDALGTPQRKSVPLPHWCYPDGGRECCALAAAADGGES